MTAFRRKVYVPTVNGTARAYAIEKCLESLIKFETWHLEINSQVIKMLLLSSCTKVLYKHEPKDKLHNIGIHSWRVLESAQQYVVTVATYVSHVICKFFMNEMWPLSLWPLSSRGSSKGEKGKQRESLHGVYFAWCTRFFHINDKPHVP